MKPSGSTILTALVALAMAMALIEARRFPIGGWIYPVVSGVMTLILAVALLIHDIRRMAKRSSPGAGASRETRRGASMDLDADEDGTRRYSGFARAFGWVLGLWLSIWLLGWQIGVAVFFVAYLVFKARAKWFVVLGLTALAMLLLIYFDRALDVFWPEGVLVRWLQDLPLF